VKARYLESHKSFYKLSLKIIIKKISTLIYIMVNLNLKMSFETIFLLNKNLNKEKP
jgi:hypothetical protein